MKGRRYDIDWLRIVAMLAVFCVHCMGFFTPFDWHLKNAERSDLFVIPTAWLDLWMMPLFFLLSGFASWYSLRSRSGGKYLLERVTRLLIPFYTMGALVLLPIQFYIERVSHNRYVGTLWQQIPPYWDSYGSFRFRLDEPYLTNVWPGHLWFLQFLFLVSVLTLPLLLYLRSEPGQRLITRLAGWFNRRGGIFLLLIPLVLVRIALRSFFHGDHTWADLFYYAVFFLTGYVMAADVRFTESYKRHSWVCLALGIAAWAAELVLILELNYPYPGAESFSWTYVLFQTVVSLANLSWVLFFLSMAARYLNFNNKLLAYGNEALLPFYILHQTVILAVGWFIIPLDLSILLKLLIISTTSFVIIMALYELLIKRFNVLRFLFGMRLKKKQQPSVEAASLEEAES
jgi:glucan biosynthesis protein C